MWPGRPIGARLPRGYFQRVVSRHLGAVLLRVDGLLAALHHVVVDAIFEVQALARQAIKPGAIAVIFAK